METYQNAYMGLPGISAEELNFLQQATADLNENQRKYFYMVYSGKRKNPQDILLFTLLGFIGAAGVQRFIVGQIGMGLLFFFTGGLCLIGTIVDLINHKSLALEYDRKMAYESYQIAKMSS
jgi:TM2 domain-containing membrane protein YozV